MCISCWRKKIVFSFSQIFGVHSQNYFFKHFLSLHIIALTAFENIFLLYSLNYCLELITIFKNNEYMGVNFAFENAIFFFFFLSNGKKREKIRQKTRCTIVVRALRGLKDVVIEANVRIWMRFSFLPKATKSHITSHVRPKLPACTASEFLRICSLRPHADYKRNIVMCREAEWENERKHEMLARVYISTYGSY